MRMPSGLVSAGNIDSSVADTCAQERSNDPYANIVQHGVYIQAAVSCDLCAHYMLIKLASVCSVKCSWKTSDIAKIFPQVDFII